jgi:uncharacterized protein
MLSRRTFLKWLGRLSAGGILTGTYAFAFEPGFRLNIQSYAFTPPNWTPGLKIRIVMLADPHCVEPHMPLSRWQNIIATANELGGDLMLLMGDYVAGHPFRSGTVSMKDAASAAGALRAPLGVFAILGNHDWWEDKAAQKSGHGPIEAQRRLEDANVPVLVNTAMSIVHGKRPFWLSATDSSVAIRKGPSRFEGRDDLEGALKQVTDDAPIIHFAHEPDLFTQIPKRVSLTLSGHTHGGQVRLFGYSPITPSSFGNRFAYGHIVENQRHLVVSGGLGCSIMPVRFGVPPEITVLELG